MKPSLNYIASCLFPHDLNLGMTNGLVNDATKDTTALTLVPVYGAQVVRSLLQLAGQRDFTARLDE